MPYLGFFDKMKQSDVLVIRDEVLFIERDFHHRNRIRINGSDNLNNPQSKFLTVPVEKTPEYIRDININTEVKMKNVPWNQSMLHNINVAYRGADHFSEFFPGIKKILDNSDEKLIDLNMKLINFLKQGFGIETPILMASELGLKSPHYIPGSSDASEDLANICEAVGADTYLSGGGGKNYLKSNPFTEKGIAVKFQEYEHPIHKQKHPGFLPYMSAIDALFCTGKFPLIEKELNVLQKV